MRVFPLLELVWASEDVVVLVLVSVWLVSVSVTVFEIVSLLELEMQAEVDKWVVCLLVTDPAAASSAAWRHRLYDDCAFEPDLDDDERDRYRAANDNAARYARWLEARFVAPGRIPELLAELRRFWRLPLAGKLSVTARAA